MYFRNTMIISGITVLLALSTSLLAAWALSLGGLRRSEAVFRTFLVALVVPGEALLVPNYLILYRMHLVNTLWAQILPFGASVYGVFLLREFFLSLPMAYWDAARLDGAGPLRFLWSVAVPMARPILVTVGLYIFIGSWNSFQWPLIVTVSHHVQPIEVAVERLQQAHSVDWRRLSAAGLMATAPLVVLFFFVQKHIVRGISRGEGISG
jgi:multiple sugar transport system permease protein